MRLITKQLLYIHFFSSNLRYAFQDEENMFMVIDLMLGGDLRFHLDRMGTIKEDLVKIWIAEVSFGLQFLHSKNIVHRDLKPDNSKNKRGKII